jgi:hypothetical protein
MSNFEIIYLTNQGIVNMNFMKSRYIKVFFTAILIFLFAMTISGVGFSGKRNTYGIYFSGNVNEFDLPERINKSFQSNAISTFLNLRMAVFSIQENLLVERSNTQICSDNYLNEFRESSEKSFLLPADFEYEIQNIKITNTDRMGILFIGSQINLENSVKITQCDSNWMVQFNHG